MKPTPSTHRKLAGWLPGFALLMFAAGCMGGKSSDPLAAAAVADAGARTLPAASPALERLRADLDALFLHPDFDHAFWGVRVETLAGDVLYDHNGHKQFVPASNMKVFTTAAAASLLGPEFHYETRLEALGPITAEGRLAGHLLITGSGDPSLGSWHREDGMDGPALLAAWVAAIRDAGIREIAGDIIGDGRAYTDEFYGGGWDLEDIPYWYAAGSSGLAFEENCFRFTTAPGKQVGDKATLSFRPETGYITVINDIVTTTAGGPKTADIVWRGSDNNIIRFAGTIPVDAEPFEQRGSVWDGTLYTATLLREALDRAGIRVLGAPHNIRSLTDPAVVDGVAPARRKLLHRHLSPSLRDILKIINKPSHNFFADHLLRTLGQQFRGRGDFETGANVLRDWLKRIGAPEPERFLMLDGSGLARRNLIQPRQMCAVLRTMDAAPSATREAFRESIAIAGVDGDLRGRMTEPPTRGNVRAKTGYIGHVRSLSGYVVAADGREFVFSMICNQHMLSTRRVDEAIGAACLLLAKCSGDLSAGNAD